MIRIGKAVSTGNLAVRRQCSVHLYPVRTMILHPTEPGSAEAHRVCQAGDISDDPVPASLLGDDSEPKRFVTQCVVDADHSSGIRFATHA